VKLSGGEGKDFLVAETTPWIQNPFEGNFASQVGAGPFEGRKKGLSFLERKRRKGTSRRRVRGKHKKVEEAILVEKTPGTTNGK